ncbi:hypothetical protein CZP2022_282 [Vibrio phage C-ZP2022]|nr:hypothetical protein CZP2022_282 [Vibrio phage C-ZP2022]
MCEILPYTYDDHSAISLFFHRAGLRTEKERTDYIPTQISCFFEEIKETLDTMDKFYCNKEKLDREQLADDLGDVLFSGMGLVYMLYGDVVDADFYEYLNEYACLLNTQQREADELTFIMKNEILSIKAAQKNFKRRINKRSIDGATQRIIAAATLLGKIFDIDVPDAFDVVIESNASKFDDNEKDAELTVQKYQTQGIKVKQACVDGAWVTRVDGTQKLDGKEWPDEKIIKSHLWREPVFGY